MVIVYVKFNTIVLYLNPKFIVGIFLMYIKRLYLTFRGRAFYKLPNKIFNYPNLA